MKPLFSAAASQGHKWIGHRAGSFLRDRYDHATQAMDLLQTYRDMSIKMPDIFLSIISDRMNKIMQVLTAIATTFIPLNLIVDICAMNFGGDSKGPGQCRNCAGFDQ